ncbi:tyrosine-type recombinase/integrase [Teichococcus oryzae]|uniref:Core-binding (CB) domain-containing protein n=1 Tax=Teichococcus oryzae TaxID=1608942 RepID=A0A5B2TBZ8_9PROT|nr:site-specific integrase [Pseudoroseomonas oryzae]KAA2211584.1 hypothetical protein F0Q34_19175 [Pseudoroseomonas oryzae]
MTDLPPATSGSLRERFVADMAVRGFTEKTRKDYLRTVAGFAAFLERSPGTATAEDIRRFQIQQSEQGMNAPAMNSTVAALRFFFNHTLDRPDLARKLIRLRYPRKLPVVLSPDEVARLIGATTCLKHRAALSVAYGAGLRVAEDGVDIRVIQALLGHAKLDNTALYTRVATRTVRTVTSPLDKVMARLDPGEALGAGGSVGGG